MPDMEKNSRPAVLVTGGAKRIGAAISRAFGTAGWHVVIHYGRSADAAELLAAELPSATAIHCNLSDADAAKDMVDRLSQSAIRAVKRPEVAEKLAKLGFQTVGSTPAELAAQQRIDFDAWGKPV